MYKNKKCIGIFSFAIAGIFLLLAGQSMCAELSKTNNAPNIDEVRSQAKAASLAVGTPLRAQDFAEVAKLSSELVKEYASVEDTVVQKYVIEAMCRVANTMRSENDYKGAVDLYEQVEKKYGKENDPEFQFWVADSIYSRALIYKNGLDDYKKAVKLFKRVSKEYKNSTDTEILCTVAYAMYQEGLTHKKLGKKTLATKCFRAVIQDFGKNENARLRQPVLNAQAELEEKKD